MEYNATITSIGQLAGLVKNLESFADIFRGIGVVFSPPDTSFGNILQKGLLERPDIGSVRVCVSIDRVSASCFAVRIYIRDQPHNDGIIDYRLKPRGDGWMASCFCPDGASEWFRSLVASILDPNVAAIGVREKDIGDIMEAVRKAAEVLAAQR